MPSMRATVTPADATPNALRPRASTAAVDRAVTVRPKPKPKSRQAADQHPSGDSTVAVDSHSRPPMLSASPTRLEDDHARAAEDET